jgi:hypothetical protein
VDQDGAAAEARGDTVLEVVVTFARKERGNVVMSPVTVRPHT